MTLFLSGLAVGVLSMAGVSIGVLWWAAHCLLGITRRPSLSQQGLNL